MTFLTLFYQRKVIYLKNYNNLYILQVLYSRFSLIIYDISKHSLVIVVIVVDVAIVSFFEAFNVYTTGTIIVTASNPKRTIPLTTVIVIYFALGNVVFPTLHHHH